MLTLDRGHLAATHQSAIEQDAGLRAWSIKEVPESTARPADELARILRWQANYWEQAQVGRYPRIRRLLARLTRPFFDAQIRFNLLVADHLVRIEETLQHLQDGTEALPYPPAGGPAASAAAEERARVLRWHANYWEQAQSGRIRKVRRVLARLTRPFFDAQIRYNLLVADHLVRIEETLQHPRNGAEATPALRASRR